MLEKSLESSSVASPHDRRVVGLPRGKRQVLIEISCGNIFDNHIQVLKLMLRSFPTSESMNCRSKNTLPPASFPVLSRT